MTSILHLSGSNESKEPLSPDPLKPSQDLGADWDNLRGLTKNVYQKPRSNWLRTALLSVLLLVALASLSLVLYNHMPALVNFGQEVSETVQRFASARPTPPTVARGPAVPDPQGARRKHRASHPSLPDSSPEQADDPAFHPFYATAIIEGRRVSLRSNNSIVVLDMGNGTWNFAPEFQ